MPPPRSPQPTPTTPGDLEFELTDFETARAAHDSVPAGVGTLSEHTPHYWDSRRRKSVLTDRALTGETLEWVLALPPALRPVRLCDGFPRIANALSAAWPDRSARTRLLNSLLCENRRLRVGFTADIRTEIEGLRGA